MSSGIERIEHNLNVVQEQISSACKTSRRCREEVTLIAVTKTVGNDEVAELGRLGIRDFGENRVVPGCEKVAHFSAENFNWHFIGHLQRNKASAVLPGFSFIHSVESSKLLKVLQKEAEKLDKTVQVYLEVNVSGEESKYGLTPQNLEPMLEVVQEYDHIRPVGLMCMAPFYDNPEDTRPVFSGLRELRDAMKSATGLQLPYLSMGMSNDYTVAIEEGATHVRVGSALFV